MPTTRHGFAPGSPMRARVLRILIGLAACAALAGPPVAVRASGGSLVVGSLPPGQVLQFDARSGKFITQLVTPGEGGLPVACCMTFGPDDHLYVTSPATNEVMRFNGVTGDFMDVFVPAGSGGLSLPVVAAFGPDGNLYVGSLGNNAILRYQGRTGAFIDAFLPPGTGGMAGYDPQFFTWGPDGHLYVSSPVGNAGILRFNGTTGALIGKFTQSMPVYDGDGGLFFGADGHLYSASYPTDAVYRFNGSTGQFIDIFVAPGSGGIKGPVGMVLGPDGDIYLAGADSNSIVRYDGRTGAFRDVFIAPFVGTLEGPRDLVFKQTTRVCHRPPGQAGAPGQTLVVPHQTARTHVDHGDTVGPCPTAAARP